MHTNCFVLVNLQRLQVVSLQWVPEDIIVGFRGPVEVPQPFQWSPLLEIGRIGRWDRSVRRGRRRGANTSRFWISRY